MLLWLGVFLANVGLAEVRTWTSTDGKSIKAEQTGLDTGNKTVTLKLDTGKLYTLPLAKLSPDDIVTAMQWRPSAAPAETSPFPCILGTLTGQEDAALGEATFMEPLENELRHVRNDYIGRTYRDPSHPEWTAIGIFDQNGKCVELGIIYSYHPKNFMDRAEFPELFNQWMTANAQGGKWVSQGENSWTNDKTGAFATQEDGVVEKDAAGNGGSNLHMATLTIRDKGQQVWFLARQTSP